MHWSIGEADQIMGGLLEAMTRKPSGDQRKLLPSRHRKTADDLSRPIQDLIQGGQATTALLAWRHAAAGVPKPEEFLIEDVVFDVAVPVDGLGASRARAVGPSGALDLRDLSVLQLVDHGNRDTVLWRDQAVAGVDPA
jgi:hypothetical protein